MSSISEALVSDLSLTNIASSADMSVPISIATTSTHPFSGEGSGNRFQSTTAILTPLASPFMVITPTTQTNTIATRLEAFLKSMNFANDPITINNLMSHPDSLDQILKLMKSVENLNMTGKDAMTPSTMVPVSMPNGLQVLPVTLASDNGLPSVDTTFTKQIETMEIPETTSQILDSHIMASDAQGMILTGSDLHSKLSYINADSLGSQDQISLDIPTSSVSVFPEVVQNISFLHPNVASDSTDNAFVKDIPFDKAMMMLQSQQSDLLLKKATNDLISENETAESTQNIPDSFNFFCVQCSLTGDQKMEMSQCNHTRELQHISDTPIISKARASLPFNLYLAPSINILCANNILGIFAKEHIPSNVSFGPLVGKSVDLLKDFRKPSEEIPDFKVFYKDRAVRFDTSDENECNWLMFLRPALKNTPNNVVVHQVHKELYFYTLKDINKDEELVFWYSKPYAKHLGHPLSQDVKSLNPCQHCGRIFINKKASLHHLKIIHKADNENGLECNVCHLTFTRPAKLKMHMRQHTGEKPFQCQNCAKSFNDKSNLLNHMLTHTDLKKFKCDTCGKTFRQKAHLKTHLLIHTGEKNFCCQYCDKKFIRETDRNQHHLLHTKEKEYVCSECNKSFHKHQGLQKHMLTHSGDKPHPCPLCQKRFIDITHLKRHQKTCKGGNAKKDVL